MPAKPLVILVHGLWMRGYEMGLLAARLREQGYPVAHFRYATVTGSLRGICARLRDTILAHRGQVALIGHSLGGVISLHTLRDYPELPVDRAICIGSPLTGSVAGRGLQRVGAGRLALGGVLPEAVFHRPLGCWDGRQQVGVIAGTRSFGPGQLVARLPAPHDGTVAVTETRLPGITDHLELPRGHAALVLSRRVATECSHFLQHGHFTHLVSDTKN